MDPSSQPPPPTTEAVPVAAPAPAASPPAPDVAATGSGAWSWWAGPAGLIGAFLGASIAGVMIIGLASLLGAQIDTSDGLDAPGGIVMLSLMAQDACFIAAPVMLAGLMSRPVRPWDFGLRRPAWGKAVGWIALFYAIFIGLSAIWQQLVSFSNESEVTDELGVNANDYALIGGLVLVCVLAPIAEELLFRGFLFTTLRNRIGAIAGAVTTGVLFGAIHAGSAPTEALPVLALLGALLCWLYVLTGSLVPCIAAHCLNNAVAYGSLVDWDWQIPLAFVASLAAILAIGRAVEVRFGRAPANSASS